MAEIKLNDSFFDEVKAFGDSGMLVKDVDLQAPSADRSNSLPTIQEYRGRLGRIGKIVFTFGLLVEKDAADFDNLAKALKTADKVGS